SNKIYTTALEPHAHGQALNEMNFGCLSSLELDSIFFLIIISSDCPTSLSHVTLFL
ncbi:hypothetical protein ACJX0J_040261, partial [Zea mays]